ncbi:hypothetical protein ANCCAN_04680 [Ancylostoma caninum]|uniref:Uncharacterized protein n=1 Tax=Ancylostoma caninum TaxID=29170 RepID=A0A368H1W3_ANCCA|nr:hypothetical protein ANCCAN_04680 [Ancylostoma caninum]
MGLKPESYLVNVFYCGTSLELHFGNIYRREEFLPLFTVCLETGRIKGLAWVVTPRLELEGAVSDAVEIMEFI